MAINSLANLKMEKGRGEFINPRMGMNIRESIRRIKCMGLEF